MPNYDPTKNCVATYYWDSNNLCKYTFFVTFLRYHPKYYHRPFSSDGHSMSQYLPYNNLRFCNDRELQELQHEFGVYKGQHLEETANMGFALEVTLPYPDDKMDSFCQYPLLR